MKRNLLLFPFFSLFLFFSCGEDDIALISLKPCCKTEPLVATVGNGQCYVPNIFTPNQDGINDLFQVHWDSNIKEVKSLIIRGNLGRKIFEEENIGRFDFFKLWDGQDGNVFYRGRFTYEIEVEALDGSIKSFIRDACCLRCDGDDNLINSKYVDQCHFSAHHNGEGGYDSTLPDLESGNCF